MSMPSIVSCVGRRTRDRHSDLPQFHLIMDGFHVRWRFDAMTDVLELDRERAKAWTLGRVLQDSLWEIQDSRPLVPDHLEVARQLLSGK
ncbi:hypothetical protein [Nocardia sp. NPDC004604]|uniref:hypothetical protein n=1 Tax=Nocardia sp. NPDC004604 TaxID=3157013 RepID=UPI0033AC2E39